MEGSQYSWHSLTARAETFEYHPHSACLSRKKLVIIIIKILLAFVAIATLTIHPRSVCTSQPYWRRLSCGISSSMVSLAYFTLQDVRQNSESMENLFDSCFSKFCKNENQKSDNIVGDNISRAVL